MLPRSTCSAAFVFIATALLAISACDRSAQTPSPPAPTTQPTPPATTRPAVKQPDAKQKPRIGMTWVTTAPATMPTTMPATLPVIKPPQPETRPVTTQPAPPPRVSNPDIESGRKLVEGGKFLEARQRLAPLLQKKLSEAEADEARVLLERVADETLFAKKPVADDPLVEVYTVESGDKLITLGRDYDVPHESIQIVNNMANPNALRIGQKIKIPRGVFHAKVYKSKFRLDLYLNDIYIRSYPVGLGAQNGTPEGAWKVKNRLKDPVWYPPESASDKKVIPAHDPNNPLGDYWVGLEGVEGAATGKEGFGIHGTIEPDSIGKSVSLGCIRMHNDDVAVVYGLMCPGRSTVTILP
jgi:LysM repeat protein